MSDENKIRDVVDAVTGVAQAIPVYDDIIQPAAKEIGKGLETIAKTIHVALAPVSALVWGYEQIKDFVSTKVAERLKNVKQEDIISPKPNVAGPVLEALRYTGHEESLSDLYANLLAASMDKNTATCAHPAFAEIIKQLTPDEAKLVGLFVHEAALPLITVRNEYRGRDPLQMGGFNILVNVSSLGQQAGCEHLELIATYIDNICRLGLATVPESYKYTTPGTYDMLEKSLEPVVQAIAASGPDRHAVLVQKALIVSELGKQFARICVTSKS